MGAYTHSYVRIHTYRFTKHSKTCCLDSPLLRSNSSYLADKTVLLPCPRLSKVGGGGRKLELEKESWSSQEEVKERLRRVRAAHSKHM